MNDLGQFHQQLIKGVRTFKMDITLVTKESCMKYSSWTEQDNECEYADDSFMMKTCCFGFSGDLSPMPILRYPFNTTSDMIQFLSDDSHIYLYEKNSNIDRYQEKVLIAINKQNGNDFSDIHVNFFYNILKVIEEKDLNIVLSYGSIKSFQNKCLNTPQNCNEKENYIANQYVILQSSYTGSGFPFSTTVNPKNVSQNLVQNFNAEFTDIEYICQSKIPEWITAFDYPIIFYEPSFEYSVQYTLQIFNSEQCSKPANYDPQRNKLAFACNQAPEMMDSFLKLKNITIVPEYGQKIVYDSVQNPVLNYQSKNGNFYLGYQSIDNQDSGSFIKVLQFNSEENNYEVNEQIEFSETILKIKSVDSYIFVEFETFYEIFENSIQNSVYKQVKSSLYTDAEIIYSQQYQEPILILLEQKAHNQGSLQLSFFKFIGEKAIYCQNILNGFYEGIEKQNIDMMASFSGQNQNLLNVLISYSKLNKSDYQYETQEIYQTSMVFVDIFSNECQIDSQFGPSLVSFGSRPRGNAYSYNGRSYMILTFENSKCEQGAILNNNDVNQCELENYKTFHQLLNVNYLLTYMYGDFESIQNRIQNKKIITSCDTEIIVGKYYNGLNSTVILQQQENSLSVVVAHSYVNYKDLDLSSTFMCGSGYYDQDYETNQAILLYSFNTVEFENIEKARNQYQNKQQKTLQQILE